MGQVQGVARPRIIGKMPPAIGQTVVAGIVQTTMAQGRPPLVALTGVVVDHVQQNLDPGAVQGLHRPFELIQRAVARFGREKPHGVIAPMVVQSLGHQKPVVEKRIDRQQLHRRHPQRFQMLDQRRMPQPGIGAAQLLGNAGMQLGQRFDMRLIDHRLGQGGQRRAVALPIEIIVHHHRFRHGKGIVTGVKGQIPARRSDPVSHQRIRPTQPPRQPLAVGVQHHLVRVEPVTFGRTIGALRAKAVQLPGPDARDMDMPDVAAAVA